jgi:hypothetical protein
VAAGEPVGRATGRASLRSPKLRAIVEEDQRTRTRTAGLKTARAEIRRRERPATAAKPAPAKRAPAKPTSAAGPGTSPDQSTTRPTRPRTPRPGSRSPRAGAGTTRPGPTFPAGGGLAGNVAGAVLGLFFWGWIMLPLLKDGPAGIKNTLRAKFFNKGPDGKYLS